MDLDTWLANLPIRCDGVVWLFRRIEETTIIGGMEIESRRWMFVGEDDITQRDIYEEDIADHDLLMGRTSPADTMDFPEEHGSPGGYMVLTDGQDQEGIPFQWRRELKQPWRIDGTDELASARYAERLERIALHALECL